MRLDTQLALFSSRIGYITFSLALYFGILLLIVSFSRISSRIISISTTTFNFTFSRTPRNKPQYIRLTDRKLLQQESASMIHKTLHLILSSLVPLLPSDNTVPMMFTPLPPTTSILLPSSYKVAFQTIWLAHLRHPLHPAELKNLLLIVHKRIIPYMNKPQLLMDWLTDSYNSGLQQQ